MLGKLVTYILTVEEVTVEDPSRVQAFLMAHTQAAVAQLQDTGLCCFQCKLCL